MTDWRRESMEGTMAFLAKGTRVRLLRTGELGTIRGRQVNVYIVMLDDASAAGTSRRTVHVDHVEELKNTVGPVGPVLWLPPRGFEVGGELLTVVPAEASLEQLRAFWRARGINGPVSADLYWRALHVKPVAVVSEQEARRLAHSWQDPFASPYEPDPLAVFAATGEIDVDGVLQALMEIELVIAGPQAREELDAMLDYFAEHGD